MRRVADRAGNPVACGEGGLRERAPEALADAGDQKVLGIHLLAPESVEL
jgi:hypothetical protein